MTSLSDGVVLVKLARETVKNHFGSDDLQIKKTKFTKKQGVFVSLYTCPEHKLRGCIGYPYPKLPLGEALQNAAFLSAFEDPRFERLEKEELDKIVFKVSILTEPKIITVKKPEEYLKEIEIGKDGLIVEYSSHRGLLLPHVPLESEPPWGVKMFLQHTCMKARLLPDMWLNDNIKIYKFQTEIFAEKTPNGEIIQTSH